MLYSKVHFTIKPGDKHYSYCAAICKAANNLRNATLFRVRQVLTMFNKDKDKLTTNKLEVFSELEKNLPAMGASFKMPSKGKTRLSWNFLMKLMKASENPDYLCKDLPRQSAQHVLKDVVESMDSFYALRHEFWKNPSAFTGKPNLPKYGKKGGYHTVKLTNQDCVIYPAKDESNTHEVKLPLCRDKLQIGGTPINGRLKEAKIVPTHGIFVLCLLMEIEKEIPPINEMPARICSIDVGVNNFAAITNNIGKPCLLFKGETIKSTNQWYNKRMADIKSKQTKGTNNKFVPTPESDRLCLKRANILSDFMHKAGKQIITWCIENSIDTIVIGENKEWKQNSNLGKVNNQNFVSIPFDKFKGIMEYHCERNGIRLIYQEESYTSKASFPDNDYLPVYGSGETIPEFSGKRRPKRYKGMYKKDGFRGLYETKNGDIINSDLNGSANIGHKALPDVFDSGCKIDFSNVVVILHPDYNDRKANKAKQTSGKAATTASKSKLRRIKAKEKTNKKVIPLG